MLEVDKDIALASTLPASFYQDARLFELLKEKVFLKSWHWVGDTSIVPLAEHVYPFTLLDGFLNEPILLTRDEDNNISCMSNVCTHRGNILVNHPGRVKKLLCNYHGRRFNLDGSFSSMPGFETTKNFPQPCDDLFRFDVRKLGNHLFIGLEPGFEIDHILDKMNERIGFLPLNEFVLEPNRNKDYLVNCHWALYCDNYLEGFHIPFVHADLNKVLDYNSYGNELFENMTLQIGYSNNAEDTFELPEGHIDYGKNIAAYYFWIYPNIMFNFYPWGLSVNIVKPLDMERTRVSFITYIYDKKKLDQGAGALLDKVEREDEFVVENVHKGLKSRFYKSGRFSPDKEQGVHYFHQLLAKSLNS